MWYLAGQSTGFRVNMCCSHPLTVFLLAFFFCFNQSGVVLAAEVGGPITAIVAGRVYFVEGEVQAANQGGDLRTLKNGDSIYVGDTLISGETATAQIRMEDGGLIAMHPATLLKFDSFKFSGMEDGTENSFFTLSQGGFRAVTGLIGRTNKQSYRITTPAAIVGIDGTDHEIIYVPENTPDAATGVYDKVNSGATIVTTDAGAVKVEAGQMGYAASMSELPQLLPINPSLFGDVTDVSGVQMEGGPAGAAPLLPGMPGIPAVEAGESETGAVKEDVVTEEVITDEIVEKDAARFVAAPIAWGGNISEGYRKLSHLTGGSSRQHVQTVNVRAASYIWQPWLARVYGGVGLVNTRQTTYASGSKGVTFNGRLGLSLAPYSRFPFSTSYSVSDSRSSESASGQSASVSSQDSRNKTFKMEQQYRTRSNDMNSYAIYNHSKTDVSAGNEQTDSRLSLHHRYRPLPGKSMYSAWYDRRAASTVEGGDELISRLKGGYVFIDKLHRVDLDAFRDVSQYRQENGVFNSVYARHTYKPDDLLSVATFADVNVSQSGNSAAPLNTRSLQASTYSTWQPDEELPLYVFGNLHFYDSKTESSSATVNSQSWRGSVSANYAATPNLTYALGETVGVANSGGRSAGFTQTEGSAAYRSDSSQIGRAVRNWGISGGADYRTSNIVAATLRIYTNANQSLRIQQMLDHGKVDYSFRQTLAASDDPLIGQRQTLTHDAGAVWQLPSVRVLSNSASFSVADMRDFGGVPAITQTASLGVDSLGNISASSELLSRINMEWRTNNFGQSSNSVRANVTYRHRRAFDVKNLRYTLILNVGQTNSEDSLPLTKDIERKESLIEQQLEYRIGRAYLRLRGSVYKVAKVRRLLIFLQLGRDFGTI